MELKSLFGAQKVLHQLVELVRVSLVYIMLSFGKSKQCRIRYRVDQMNGMFGGQHRIAVSV